MFVVRPAVLIWVRKQLSERVIIGQRTREVTDEGTDMQIATGRVISHREE